MAVWDSLTCKGPLLCSYMYYLLFILRNMFNLFDYIFLSIVFDHLVYGFMVTTNMVDLPADCEI